MLYRKVVSYGDRVFNRTKVVNCNAQRKLTALQTFVDPAGSWRNADNTIEMYDVKDSTAPAAAAAADAATVLRQPGRTEERLLRHLFGGEFDVDARGVDQTNTTVTVRIQFLLLRIQGLVGRSRCIYVCISCPAIT